jgi:hypothetical protein
MSEALRLAHEIVAEARLMGASPPDQPLLVLAREVVRLSDELRVERRKPKVRPGHHPPCPAMLDSEACCTCGQ